MATSDQESYNMVLDRMSSLTDLASHIETLSAEKNKQSASMMKLISEMSETITDVRENVDKIRTGSVVIGNRIKEVIKSSEQTQKTNLSKIKASITELGNVKPLNESLQKLDEQVKLLATKALPTGSVTSSIDSSKDEKSTGSVQPPSSDVGSVQPPSSDVSDNNNVKKGGYTYSNSSSRRSGNGRRRRTKKTRRRGSRRH